MPSSPRPSARAIALCSLLTLIGVDAAAIETQRNCAIALSNDQFVVLSGHSGTVLDVLANDSGQFDRLSLVTAGQTTAAGGIVQVVDGKISYNPPPNFAGEDSFSYRVTERDWRDEAAAVEVRLSDAGAPPATTALGLPVIAAPALGAGSDWEAGSGMPGESVFGRLVRFEADYTGCYQDSDPSFDLQLRWTLTKRQGVSNPANQFEASISPLSNHPTAALASQSYAWPAPSTRQLNLLVDDLAASQLEGFRAGLFAQARDSYDTYKWRSSHLLASATMDTDHCLLCSREARVSITVDSDSDGDGVSDSSDADDDNDGLPDALETHADSDGDGIANHLDLDSDNDGLLDLIEAGGSNAGGNGRVSGGRDADGDGWNDQAEASLEPERDSDGDGLPDFLDLDSDNDGTPDLVEQGAPDRAPRDGRVDGFRDGNGDGVHDLSAALRGALDTDGDGAANAIDRDSDGDGSPDAIENELSALDSDRDGAMDAQRDSDGNGIPDGVDASHTGGVDSNDNGVDDRFDAELQLGTDADNDDIIDGADPDSDGDGWLDAAAPRAPVDHDGNGVPDYLQADYRQQSGPIGGDDGNNGGGGGGGASATTGLSGHGGCSHNPQARLDPTLIALLLLSCAYLLRRRARP